MAFAFATDISFVKMVPRFFTRIDLIGSKSTNNQLYSFSLVTIYDCSTIERCLCKALLPRGLLTAFYWRNAIALSRSFEFTRSNFTSRMRVRGKGEVLCLFSKRHCRHITCGCCEGIGGFFVMSIR